MPTIEPAQLSHSILCLGVCSALLVLLPLIPVLLWRRSHKSTTTWFYLLAGALGFLISARVLELGLHMIFIVNDNPISRFVNGHTWAYVLYGITAAGVFEEVGRWVVLGKLLKKNRTPQNAVLYGLGHGGIEVWAVVLLLVVQLLLTGLAIQSQGLEAGLASMGVTPELYDAFLPTLNMLLTFDGSAMLLNVLERALAMTFHTAATVIVFCGVQKHDKKYLLCAVLAHMLADMAAALYQRGVCPLWLAQLWLLAWVIPLTVWAVRLYREMSTGSRAQKP